LMVNCSDPVSHDGIRILTEARVRVITFAPHTTQIFHVLDLTLFGILKQRPRYELPFDDNNATVRFMIKYITPSRKQRCRPRYGEHFVRLDLSLIREESRKSFYSRS
jgi:hypothetical protein